MLAIPTGGSTEEDDEELLEAIRLSQALSSTTTTPTATTPLSNNTNTNTNTIANTNTNTNTNTDTNTNTNTNTNTDTKKDEPVVTIGEEPEKGENTCHIVLRLPDGSRVERRFLKTDSLKVS